MSQDYLSESLVDGSGLSFAIVAARYNCKFVDHLLKRVITTLVEASVEESDITTIRVPGSHEIPFAANLLAETGDFQCVIGLGVVIAGETDHHNVIGMNVSKALIQIGLDSGIPVINGILVVATKAQAEARCGEEIDRGADFGVAALEMATLSSRWDSGSGEEMVQKDR
jgi:6,7-dimethyl-8-ribityllumazine synthase